MRDDANENFVMEELNSVKNDGVSKGVVTMWRKSEDC